MKIKLDQLVQFLITIVFFFYPNHSSWLRNVKRYRDIVRSLISILTNYVSIKNFVQLCDVEEKCKESRETLCQA